MSPYQNGDRVVLIATTDPLTKLKPGDAGTVTGWNERQSALYVSWDSGSTLSMLLADGDVVRPERPLDNNIGNLDEDPDCGNWLRHQGRNEGK